MLLLVGLGAFVVHVFFVVIAGGLGLAADRCRCGGRGDDLAEHACGGAVRAAGARRRWSLRHDEGRQRRERQGHRGAKKFTNHCAASVDGDYAGPRVPPRDAWEIPRSGVEDRGSGGVVRSTRRRVDAGMGPSGERGAGSGRRRCDPKLQCAPDGPAPRSPLLLHCDKPHNSSVSNALAGQTGAGILTPGRHRAPLCDAWSKSVWRWWCSLRFRSRGYRSAGSPLPRSGEWRGQRGLAVQCLPCG